VVVILHTEGANKAQQDEAQGVLGMLCAAYPGHPWAVRVHHGIIFIRHLQNGNNWGMNLRTSEADHDAAVLKKKVILLAGEFLERAGLVRGRENGDEIIRVEGIPDKWQNVPENPVQIQTAVAESESLRTTPRPQVLKGASSG
jgi:hypothetical protein